MNPRHDIRRMRIYIALLVLLAAVFLIWPEIDLIVAGVYYDPDFGYTGFPAGYDETFLAIHKGITMLGIALAVTVVACLVIHLFARRPMGNRNGRVLIYLLVAAIAGPGLLVNVVLKDNWGRARPYQIEDFGRDKKFTPAFVIADQCKRNCSFVSGDVATAAYLSAFAFVARHRRNRKRLFLAALAATTLVGWLRIHVGAHFLSDVLFSALFVFGVNWFLHRQIVLHRSGEPSWIAATWAGIRRLWRRNAPV